MAIRDGRAPPPPTGTAWEKKSQAQKDATRAATAELMSRVAGIRKAASEKVPQITAERDQSVANALSAGFGEYWRAQPGHAIGDNPTPEDLRTYLKTYGVQVPPSVLEKVTYTPWAPPGPAETSPGQFPPPGQSSQASPLEDLFHRINAQPWSAARKRAVFRATAAQRGLV